MNIPTFINIFAESKITSMSAMKKMGNLFSYTPSLSKQVLTVYFVHS